MAYLDNVTNILQIQPDGLPTVVRLSQNEDGRRLYFRLVGNEDPIPSGVTVTISGTKPDGVVYSATGSITNDVVLINENTQMTAVAGTWDAKIKIVSSGQTIATGRVRFEIDADPVAPGSVPSDSELEGLVAEAQAYAENARSAAYGSPLTASTVAGMTDQTRVYVYTGSETGYTAGNWYYWNGTAWTSGGVYNSTALQTDTTLAIPGMAADAKATGDAIGDLDDRQTVSEGEITQIKSDLEHVGVSESVKIALLSCFDHVAWIDEHGQTYYDALEAALYEGEYPKIIATFNPGINVIYTDDSLNILKQYLVVKYKQTIDSQEVIIASSDYTLSGVLNEGENIIRVSYDDLSTTFIVNAVDFYSILEWSTQNNLLRLNRAPGVYNDTCGYSDTDMSNRRSLWASRGKKGAYDDGTGSISNTYFPIPIPDSATTVTVTISNISGAYFAIGEFTYHSDTEKYSRQVNGGWKTNGTTITLSAGANRFATINLKVNSGGTTAFSVEPIVSVVYS